MILPDGWRFVPARLAGALLEPGYKPLDLTDTFTFDCKGLGDCCGHADDCGHRDLHAVGAIKWTHSDRRWQCPFVKDHLCLIHKSRPISCRLFPVGLNLFPEGKAVALWWTIGCEKTCTPCYSGRRWTVEEWLDDNGMTERLAPVIARLERGEPVGRL